MCVHIDDVGYTSNVEVWANTTLRPAVIESWHRTKRYAPLSRVPVVHLVSLNHPTLRSARFPGAKAFTNSAGISLAYPEISHNEAWTHVLDHEMFHFAVIETLADHHEMPTWFNEAIACVVGHTYLVAPADVDALLSRKSELYHHIAVDSLLDSCDLGVAAVKTFGSFLCDRYDESFVKDLLSHMRNSQSFASSLERVYGKGLTSLLDEWMAAAGDALERYRCSPPTI